MPYADIIRRHNAYMDSLLQAFERELNSIVASAQAHTQAYLQERLSIVNGVIQRSVQSSRVLRKLDSIFMAQMERAGFGMLCDELAAQFPGQLPYFFETLDMLSATMKTPLPKVEFSQRDLQVFADQGLAARDGLTAAMETIAARAKTRVMMTVGGLPFRDLITALVEQVQRGLPEVAGLAETATATYYRTISDRGYRIIEADLPEMKQRYRYEGPLDKLNRPFCRRLLDADKTYTRAQIDKMSNGQIPNVFLSCGGFRCRHIWLISID